MIFHGIFFLDRVNASFNILVINLRNVRLGKINNKKNKDWKKRTKMENYWEIRQKWKHTTNGSLPYHMEKIIIVQE